MLIGVAMNMYVREKLLFQMFFYTGGMKGGLKMTKGDVETEK